MFTAIFCCFSWNCKRNLGKSYGDVFWTLWIGTGIKKSGDGAKKNGSLEVQLGNVFSSTFNLHKKYSVQHTEGRKSGRRTNWCTGDRRARNGTPSKYQEVRATLHMKKLHLMSIHIHKATFLRKESKKEGTAPFSR